MMKYLLLLFLLGNICQAEKESEQSDQMLSEANMRAAEGAFDKLLKQIEQYITNVASRYMGSDEPTPVQKHSEEHEHDEQHFKKEEQILSEADYSLCNDTNVNATCEDHKREAPGICCNQTLCSNEHDGVCRQKWQKGISCDYLLEGFCDGNFECYCCVECEKNANSKCSKTKGECKKDCGKFMFRDLKVKCHSPYCSCCVNCSDNFCDDKKGSVCVSAKHYCGKHSYIESVACVGDDCVCCRPCDVNQNCTDIGGYPLRNGEVCDPGFEIDLALGTEHCSCCKPICEASTVCKMSSQGNQSGSFCTDGDCPEYYKKLKGGCGGKDDACSRCVPGKVKECKADSNCQKKGGFCSNTSCGMNYVNSTDHCPGGNDCVCCIPDCA